MKLLGLLIASAAAFGGMVGGKSGLPPQHLFVEDYDKERLDFFSIFCFGTCKLHFFYNCS